MIHPQERSLNHFQRLKDFWDDFVQPNSLSGFFCPRKVTFKIPINSGLGQAGIASPQKMSGFIRCSFQSKMTFRRHQIPEDDLTWPGPFRLFKSRIWPGPGQSSSVIWWRRKMTYQDLMTSGSHFANSEFAYSERGSDETRCLKSSSRDERWLKWKKILEKGMIV